MKTIQIALLLAAFFSTSAGVCQAFDQEFTWIQNPESATIGYKICYGTTPEELSAKTYCDDVGNNIIDGRGHGTIYNLLDDTRYFFAVMAYGSDNDESGLSKVASHDALASVVIDTAGDYDGDGTLDRSKKVSEGYWMIDKSGDGFEGNGTWDEIHSGLVGNGTIPYPDDYDGDGKTDLITEHPSSGECYVNLSNNGFSTWDSVLSNYACSRKIDLGVYRASNKTFYINKPTGTFAVTYAEMQSGDIPLIGDWDGNKVLDSGFFRPPIATFFLEMPHGVVQHQFGLSTDIPISGDWNGDGKSEIGVFRNAAWYLDMNGNHQWDNTTIDKVASFGLSTDKPVIGDWNGDGKSEIGVFRNAAWYLDMNGNHQWDNTTIDKVASFGLSTDKPVIGDWNGDGKSEIGVFRNAAWYLDMNGNHQWDNTTIDKTLSYGFFNDMLIFLP